MADDVPLSDICSLSSTSQAHLEISAHLVFVLDRHDLALIQLVFQSDAVQLASSQRAVQAMLDSRD